MILFLCFVFPPLAVLMMGRPFSTFLNMVLLCLFWIPAVKHALTIYADYKHEHGIRRITKATHNPDWVQQRYVQPEVGRREVASQHTYEPPSLDNPYIGGNGTVFKRK
jgi:uncharacterized membrane protein YqaE (UPF0057 family)